MDRKRWPHIVPAICMSFILLTSTLLVGGCGRNEQVFIDGWVSAGDAVSGASLAIHDTKGKQISQSDGPVTSSYGSFAIAVEHLPADFRIVASGGTVGGQALTGDLSADYRNFDPTTSTVHIDPATTLVSAFMDKNAGITLAEATAAVKTYLEIPEWAELDAQPDASGTYFDGRMFMKEADAAGGSINDYVNGLAAHVGATGATHPFVTKTNSLLGSVGGDAASFVARGLASGALTYTGGDVMGWALGELGLNIFGSDKGVAEMQAQLAQLSNQLSNLSLQITDLEQKLKAEIDQTNYDVRVNADIDLFTSISNIRKKMAVYVTADFPNKESRDTARRAIMQSIETSLAGPGADFVHNLDLINNQLVGIGFTTPLLKTWSQIVLTPHRFLSARDSDRIYAQFDYFDTMQLWLTEMLVEYAHAKVTEYKAEQATRTPDSKEYKDDAARIEQYLGYAQDAVNTYNQNRTSQLAMIGNKVSEKVMMDKQLNIMIYEGDYFNFETPDGSFVKTKAPPYLTWSEAYDLVRDMNAEEYLGFSNWRLLKWDGLMQLLHGTGPSGNARRYAEEQGWAAPVPTGMWLGGINTFWVTPWDEQDFMGFNMDNSATHDFGADDPWGEVAKLHWIIARDMEGVELSQYFP